LEPRAARKLAAILVADVAGYSRLAEADEDRTLARLRGLSSNLIDPAIASHYGRIVKRTGDGSIIEFRSVVDAVQCAIEVQNGMVPRNSELPSGEQIMFRVGIHLGDVIEEADGDLMGDGVNIAARLESVAKPGGICLSNAAYEQLHGKLREKFADLGERRLKNISRPVRVYGSDSGSGTAVLPTGAEPIQPPRLSIVVLPFANIGGDPEQEYFVDGVTESLTTDLSRIRGSFVIARNTAFTYKGKAIDARRLASELNVRYLLEGSVQRGCGRMRVNVQLIEAENGNHIWAERFDKPVVDFFDMQDEIVARLANRLSKELVSAEARRSERAPNPDSFDHFLQGLAWHNKGPSSENLDRARTFFEHALTLDAGNVDALVQMASVDFTTAVYLFSDDKADRLARAEAALMKALSLAPDHARAHNCLGCVLGVTNRVEQAIAECERALAIDRNLAPAHAVIGVRKLYLGRPEETEGHFQEALRLSPQDTAAHYWVTIAGAAKFCLGLYEEAINRLRQSLEINRNNQLTHVFLAATLAHLGRSDEARAATRDVLALNPQMTIARSLGFFASFMDRPINVAARQRFIDGLRNASLPEE
jgi:TolB-like protein/class 3 adenylate cyclase/Flp pilus assembly protein TadD